MLDKAWLLMSHVQLAASHCAVPNKHQACRGDLSNDVPPPDQITQESTGPAVLLAINLLGPSIFASETGLAWSACTHQAEVTVLASQAALRHTHMQPACARLSDGTARMHNLRGQAVELMLLQGCHNSVLQATLCGICTRLSWRRHP